MLFCTLGCNRCTHAIGWLLGLYSWLQLQVERASKLFKQAGCVQSDIKAALTSHIKHDEIDIPQDEPEEAKKVMLLSLVLPIMLLCQRACLGIGESFMSNYQTQSGQIMAVKTGTRHVVFACV